MGVAALLAHAGLKVIVIEQDLAHRWKGQLFHGSGRIPGGNTGHTPIALPIRGLANQLLRPTWRRDHLPATGQMTPS
ncbi:MAG: hypothetical protein M0C28_22240 [Candidatus Moduliflexus flocculans]|nr:hypothetical protein [Candidatus Moduliflexus flocculans]